MKFLSTIILALVLTGATAQSQADYEKDRKKVDAAIKVFNKKDYQDGIDKLTKHMNKQMKQNLIGFPSLYAYETLVKMEFMKYERNKAIFDELEITVEDGEDEPDSLTLVFLQSLKDYPLEYFLSVCRRATIESQSYTADIYLRRFLVDYDPDTLISEEAKKIFSEGEDHFFKEDYELAELSYRKALDLEPGYYKAMLYLGDTFWAKEDYDSAIVYYTLAKTQHPGLLEPRKYIIDALMEQGLYFRAKQECLDAMTVYPGFGIKLRMQKILQVENKYMNDHRFTRYFYPNNMKEEEQRNLNGIWNTYRSSKYKISRYCNEDGIIEPNPVTEDKYLEVYSYRRLLTEHEDELPRYMKFAYKMMEQDYLECYVFISMFHIDIYPQVKEFMKEEENREKAKEYVEKFLIEND